jgi:hypothetical protein
MGVRRFAAVAPDGRVAFWWRSGRALVAEVDIG